MVLIQSLKQHQLALNQINSVKIVIFKWTWMQYFVHHAVKKFPKVKKLLEFRF